MSAAFPTVHTVVGPAPGPTVAILGGVHGDEYEGVIAATALERIVRVELACGQVLVAAPAHPAAWTSRTRDSPIDGANLARVFPGRPDGGPTEQVAHVLTEQLIRRADLLVDLHSAGANFEMPLLCGYHGGDDRRGAESRRCADAFAAKFTWHHEGPPAPGRSLSAAYDLGIPAIYVESHGGRSIRVSDLQGYLDGVRRVLHVLGMLVESPPPSNTPVHVLGDGNTDAGIAAPATGYLVVHCGVGDLVSCGDVIATVIDVEGAPLAPIVAPYTGFVMLLRRDARVSIGDTACILASPNGET